MLICKAYKYLYYQNYSWRFRLSGGQKHGWNGYPEQWAAGGMAFTFSLYFYSVVAFSLFIGIKGLSNLVDMLGNAVIVLILIMHFVLFLYKRRYKAIIQEFQTNDPMKQKKGTIIFWSYVVGAMISFAIGCFLEVYSVHTGFTLLKYFGF